LVRRFLFSIARSLRSAAEKTRRPKKATSRKHKSKKAFL